MIDITVNNIIYKMRFLETSLYSSIEISKIENNIVYYFYPLYSKTKIDWDKSNEEYMCNPCWYNKIPEQVKEYFDKVLLLKAFT